ncbi:MAG: DUF3108 domain-containing protein [Campylobacterales bacterium]|nr:DUF3108 domain-containing protein [Campylobacterales bacterium]
MKILVRVIMIFASIVMLAEAKTIEVDYKVEFGIVGEIGVAHAKLIQNDNNTYEIDIQLTATGLAKALSGGRKERHVSKGHIENGIMVSDFYQVIKTSGSKMSNEIYRTNHKKKEVSKAKKKWKNGKKIVDETKIVENMYAKDDLLTLYFNLNTYIKDKQTSKQYRFPAVGAEIQDGYVDIYIPKSSELPEYKKMLGSEASWYARAIVNQDIFSSEKGELFLSIAEDGIAEKAVLKDLILFGDIRAKRL